MSLYVYRMKYTANEEMKCKLGLIFIETVETRHFEWGNFNTNYKKLNMLNLLGIINDMKPTHFDRNWARIKEFVCDLHCFFCVYPSKTIIKISIEFIFVFISDKTNRCIIKKILTKNEL